MDKIETVRARCLTIGLLAFCVMPLAGCRICADCEDLAYPAYGGAWQRTMRESGRVGSIFDPGGARASELVPRDTPPDPNELDRQRQEERDGKTPKPERPMDDESLPDEEREKDFEEQQRKENELRKKRLEDIEQEMEEELRNKSLDDINVRIVPGQPMPPILQ